MAVIKKTLAGAEEDEVADFKQALARRKESNAQEVSPPAGIEIVKHQPSGGSRADPKLAVMV
jgi:hypothetical protein